MGGVAATEQVVLFGTRDALDRTDIFFCVDALTGAERWRFQYPAMPPAGANTRNGRLDFGNAPRATPAIVGERVIFLGAMGHVHCLNLQTGKLIWSFNLLTDFDGRLPDWGYSGSPLIVDGMVILQPGGEECSLLAVQLEDGEVVWESSGRKASYSSFIAASVGGMTQLIGLDAETIGGWDLATGERLWELVPPINGEFQVPTPVFDQGQLYVVGENNGARVFRFSNDGRPELQPVGQNSDCHPDTHSPVIMGSYLVALHHSLMVMRADNLEIHQELDDSELSGYGSFITDGENRLLALTSDGLLCLLELKKGALSVISRLKLTSKSGLNVYSHPALVGNRFYCIIDGKLHALNFE
ncbi:MAG: PQQ-like beta-propeller repeat protein [Pirellulaceae bacterium]|nr:PQQ-like beta-propeller repeat protein [Pirellulaceae bacterium]